MASLLVAIYLIASLLVARLWDQAVVDDTPLNEDPGGAHDHGLGACLLLPVGFCCRAGSPLWSSGVAVSRRGCPRPSVAA